MKFAIIGANSYIARNLVYKLKKEYSDIDLNLYGKAEEQADGVDGYTKVDLFNIDDIKKVDFNCDAVFVFAGKTGSANGFDEFDIFIDSNEKILLNILNEYRRQGSKAKIIYPSTRLVYKGKAGLQKEDSEKEFKTIYAINKYACEQYLEQYHRVFDVRYCIFRICVPYGSLIEGASSYGTVEFMLNKAKNGNNISLYGDGSVRRTLTYIGDLCKVLIEGAISDKCVNEVFNIGGEDYTLKEMAILIAEKYGVGIEYVEYPEVAEKIESGDTVFDDNKLKERLKLNYEMPFLKWCMEG
jgi:UDP-glucose 4-epimerase